jgi:hypothetical protein
MRWAVYVVYTEEKYTQSFGIADLQEGVRLANLGVVEMIKPARMYIEEVGWENVG